MELEKSKSVNAQQRFQRMCLVACVALVMLSAGCGARGPAMAPAGGTVLYNGQPLANADVVFIPEDKGPSAVGQSAADGKFTLSTSGRPGAMVGKHQVAIQATERRRRDGKADPVPSQELVPESELKSPYVSRSVIPTSYANQFESGLNAEVKKSGENQFTFELTGPAGAK